MALKEHVGMPYRQRQLETHLHLPNPVPVASEYFGMSQASPSMESIASYGGIVCSNAHKLCKLNCQSCRRIGKPCRRDDSSMSRRNLSQADAAHDSCGTLRQPQLCGDKFRNTQTNANKQINTQLFRISLHECTFSAQPRVSPLHKASFFFFFQFDLAMCEAQNDWEYQGISAITKTIITVLFD